MANSTMLTRCCIVRMIVTLVKCTPPTSALSAGVPTRKTDPSKTSKCIREKRADRAGCAKKCDDHVVTSFFYPCCCSVDIFQRKNTFSRTANRGFNQAGKHMCKLGARDGCRNEFKDWQKVEKHHEELREGQVPVHCGYDEVGQA